MRFEGEVSLTVTRAGEDILVTGRLNPHPLITERVGVLVSGLLIAQPVLRDTARLGDDNGLMVHDVEPGSMGDDLEFDYWDILTAIGGKHYVDVRALYEDLKNAWRASNN